MGDPILVTKELFVNETNISYNIYIYIYIIVYNIYIYNYIYIYILDTLDGRNPAPVGSYWER